MSFPLLISIRFAAGAKCRSSREADFCASCFLSREHNDDETNSLYEVALKWPSAQLLSPETVSL